MTQIPTRIFCAAGNKYYAEIAIRYGFRYGARLITPRTKVYFPPYFTDQKWDDPNRAAYMAALAKHRPAIASVLDLEREEQFDEVLSWAEEAAQYVSEAVIIIPKYNGAAALLPREIKGTSVRLGYSVPTGHGATYVPVEEFAGWPVHLLGGNPDTQYELASCFDTVSVDCNMHMDHAGRNCFFSNTKTRARNRDWPMLKESVFGYVKEETNRLAFTLSCMNIQAMWQGCKATVRFAVERDIPQILKIAQMYRSELGYVNPMALRESVSRRNLVVASHNGQAQIAYSDILVSPGSEKILGFVNYRACRDGWQTVYEIGVHRDWKGQHVGAGLLAAVPSPIRLKCTTDNAAGNAFYEAQGFTHQGIHQGKKRPLNIWHRATTEAVRA